jgi:mannose-6-phosphate isomerase-like protein (cupin superfamily)
MPVFGSGPGQAPAWCELEFFEILSCAAGESIELQRVAASEQLVGVTGRFRLASADTEIAGESGSVIALPASTALAVVTALEPATVVRLCGHWGDERGGCGLFRVVNSDAPHDNGDPVPYHKETNFDSHYHDCDEYWILIEGSGLAVSEGVAYAVGPGSCVATGMGHHHDFPRVEQPVLAVFFETTLERARRRGHLWDHRDGLAQPHPERV